MLCNSTYIHYSFYNKNDIVQNEYDHVDSIIFVKSGRLRVDKEITLDHTNYWPLGKKNWEECTTKSKKIRTILKIDEGSYIGVRELE